MVVATIAAIAAERPAVRKRLLVELSVTLGLRKKVLLRFVRSPSCI
jgi:hypothetical protein